MVNAVELMQNVQLACLAVIFTCMALTHRKDSVLRLVWLAFLVLGVAGVIDLLGPSLPNWVVRGLNYDAAPIAYGLLNLAVATFVGRSRWTQWLSVVLAVGVLPFFMLWANVDARQMQSIAVIDTAMCLQTACTAWILLRNRERATATPRYTMSAFFAVFSAVSLYRAVAVFVLHTSPDTLLPWMEFVTVSIFIISVSILPLNLIWLLNARMADDLTKESHVDPLTGLLNRRGLAEAAHRELARYTRGRQDFAVAVADLDHFKALNDTYGHGCGDEVLRSIAALFREVLRQSDVVSRSGGEEFVLLLPVTRDYETVAVLERLRITQETRTVRMGNGVEVRATISIGITNTGGRTDLTWSELQEEADQALYAAKRRGRNRTVQFHELSGTPDGPDKPGDLYGSAGALPTA